jgi:hypothetical protein
MGWRVPGTTWLTKNMRGQNFLVYAIWGTLAVAGILSLSAGRWSLAFVSAATFLVSILPAIFFDRFDIKLPVGFFAAIVLFVFAALFLGEAFDFYERYWWWDVLLHGGSAIGFGLIGFVFMLMLFHGDRYAAPPIAIAFMAWCFALSVGVCWEIFEFLVDFSLGTNMQKSGLMDTMGDLMMDAFGASVGATAGFFYLKGQEFGSLSSVIRAFVRQNRRFFRDDDKP